MPFQPGSSTISSAKRGTSRDNLESMKCQGSDKLGLQERNESCHHATTC